MKRTSHSSRAVLVSWVSVNNGAAPIVAALTPSQWPRPQGFDRLYLCWRDPKGDSSGKAVLKRTLDELQQALPACPEIVPLGWRTDRPPTDHVAIRQFAEGVLLRIREDNPDATITLHLSPGTPAMHAVWLALGSTGSVEGPLQLIQAHREDQVAADAPRIEVLSFKLDTWLQRYRQAQPDHAGSDDTGHRFDPSQARSPALLDALTQLKRWAPLRVPVLLLGERGTGKTTLANLLRTMSPYQRVGTNTWPSVVCGQFRVNPQLAQARLFGHEKGAFTGAVKAHPGLLEAADGDSLFLDEVADLDRDTQRMLMAALEGRGFQRIGSTETRNANFRLICATNCSIERLRDDILDPDFFDRIGTFVLQVPPLRECREDIPRFWAYTLRDAMHSAGVSPQGWQDYAGHAALIRRLQAHALPGNFRDLQRVAYHLLAALESGCQPEDVLDQALSTLPVPTPPGMHAEDVAALASQLPTHVQSRLNAHELAWYQAALFKSAGNQTEAAKLLDLARKTFVNRLDKLSGNKAR